MMGRGLRAVLQGSLIATLIATAVPASLAQVSASQASPRTISGPEISMLIRTTLVALHQANQTGNYTVLRDLGAARFRAENDAARLAGLFAPFRERRIDLGPAVLFDARLDAPPLLTTEGVLRMKGHVPTSPQEIVFDLTYRFEHGGWRVASVNVALRMAAAAVTPPNADRPPEQEARQPLPRPTSELAFGETSAAD